MPTHEDINSPFFPLADHGISLPLAFHKADKPADGMQICKARMDEMANQFHASGRPAGYADSLHTNIPYVGSDAASGIEPVQCGTRTDSESVADHKKKLSGMSKKKKHTESVTIFHTVLDPVTGIKNVRKRNIVGIKNLKTLDALDLNACAGETEDKYGEFDIEECFRQRRLQLHTAQASSSRSVEETSVSVAGSSTDAAFDGSL